MHSVELLRTDDALRAQMQRQYRYILVDEFQDTNIAQLELLWLLAGERRNICRGRRRRSGHLPFPRRVVRQLHHLPETLLRRRRTPSSGPAAQKFLVSLSQNYRSTQRILRVAGEVIRTTKNRRCCRRKL